MLKITEICFIVCLLKKKQSKIAEKISPYSGHTRGGGGQDGKWSHFPPFFLEPFPKLLCALVV